MMYCGHFQLLQREERLSSGLCEPTYLVNDGPEDQVSPKGIETEFVAEDQHDDVVKRVIRGKVQLVFISPET